MKIVLAIAAGARDPRVLAALRDRRCKCPEPEIAEGLDGRYRPGFVSELRHCLSLWEKYGEVIAELDGEIAAHLRLLKRESDLLPLPPKPHTRHIGLVTPHWSGSCSLRDFIAIMQPS